MSLPILICTTQGVGSSAGVAVQGELAFVCSGVAGGITQLQISPDDGTTWINVGSALSADGVIYQNIPLGAQVRITVATAGSVTCRAGLWDNH
jgi:hypothetical protein